MVPLYDDETVPLPLRILACVNIEVGTTFARILLVRWFPRAPRIVRRVASCITVPYRGRIVWRFVTSFSLSRALRATIISRDGSSKNRNLVYLSLRTARRPFALSPLPRVSPPVRSAPRYSAYPAIRVTSRCAAVVTYTRRRARVHARRVSGRRVTARGRASERVRDAMCDDDATKRLPALPSYRRAGVRWVRACRASPRRLAPPHYRDLGRARFASCDHLPYRSIEICNVSRYVGEVWSAWPLARDDASNERDGRRRASLRAMIGPASHPVKATSARGVASTRAKRLVRTDVSSRLKPSASSMMI